ncbi:unnamed protein product [Closterium sp. Naga37s-1]|nr:unnamed protein product [Closterium sp. Naga37s-1]
MACPAARLAVHRSCAHARHATSLQAARSPVCSHACSRPLHNLATPSPPSALSKVVVERVRRIIAPVDSLDMSAAHAGGLGTWLARGPHVFLRGQKVFAKERAFSGWLGDGQRGAAARAEKGGGVSQRSDRGGKRGKPRENASRGGGGGRRDGAGRRGSTSSERAGKRGGRGRMDSIGGSWGEVGRREEWGEGKAQVGDRDREAVGRESARDNRPQGDGGHARGLEGGAEGDGEMGGEKVRGEAREHGDEWRGEGGKGRSGRGGRGNIIDEVAAAMEKPPARVILKRGRAALFASASPAPLVFSGAVDCVLGRPPPKAGDLVVLAARRGEQGRAGAKGEGDADGGGEAGEGGGGASGEWSRGVAVAWGVFNPTSMYRVRIMQTLSDAQRHPEAVLCMPSLLRLRLASSLNLRLLLGLSPLPCPAAASTQGAESTERSTRGGVAGATVDATGGGTNAFRLVNSEGDRLSGLIVDVYGERMVVASSAAWVEAHRPAIMQALSHLLPAASASTQECAEGVGDGGVAREGQGGSGLEGHERIVWRRSVEMLKEEGVVVEGGEGEGRRDNGGEKPADGEAFGGLESVAVEDGDEMLDDIDSSQEGKVERGATVAVDSGHQEVATVASGLPAQLPLLKAAFEDPSDDDRVKVMENGVGFWVAMASGQKTGFYSDQRDSRLFLRSLVASSLHGRGSSAVHNGLTPADATFNGDRDTGSQNATDGQSATSTSLSPAAAVDTGRAFPPSPLSAHRPLSRVLDLCCYSGGFAINAALAGASDVTAVDSSPSALSLAAANVVLNGLQPSAVRFERADISAFMQRAVAQQQQWDLVVLDPPKLAPTRKSLPRALHRYRRLNSLALRLVAPGGLLMTCSCSGAVSQQHLLLGILREAAASAGRQVTVVREAGAAPCHPIDPACPESTYLTNLLAFVH